VLVQDSTSFCLHFYIAFRWAPIFFDDVVAFSFFLILQEKEKERQRECTHANNNQALTTKKKVDALWLFPMIIIDS